jgi:diguanylate cyclase (GGDEF)-like protein/putative nucleotidyltransferase with HDIG domain
MPIKAKLFIVATAATGLALFLSGLIRWHSEDLLRFAVYLAITLISAQLKVRLPGIDGTMSVMFLFILLGVLELSLPEVLLLGCGTTLAQCLWSMKRPARPVRIVFNVFGMMAPAIWSCYWVYAHSDQLLHHSIALKLVATAGVFFLCNTVPIAAIITLTEGAPFRKTWSETYFWTFPYYLAGAGLVLIFHYLNVFAGWETCLLALPVVYWIYRSYRLYLDRLEDEKRRVEAEKRHVEDMAELHLRTIEALALAIDAKDHTTHDHLQRVCVYAEAIGKQLHLQESELEGLKTAAILHDIGKLAVPENIISKPGRLTPEEFDKMKIHPVVGAKILERVKFPYPVAPIVRSHHEKWDGSGYPDGLVGEAIPIAARILSAVDCLDALASPRQYRPALPLDQAMESIATQSGKEFDPAVVAVLKRHYLELEEAAQRRLAQHEFSSESEFLPGNAVAAPAAGFQDEKPMRAPPGEYDFLSSIAGARQEAQMLFELTHDLGNSLSLDDTLSVVSSRLRKLIAYDALAIWIREGAVLVPKHVTGDDFRLFSSLEIPIGQGLSGWVVQNGKPILNGNPSVEPGYLQNPAKFSTLSAALSAPLEGLAGIIGALSLYRADTGSFGKDDLRILLAISSKIALSIENALKFQQVQSSATTDYLTGLPNARSLFLHLDREVARCKRTGSTVAVMVCDLDNFKNINDCFGHLEGNRVLRSFSRALRDSCREYDYVARMGGDEFVLIIPGLTPEAVQPKSERIKDLAQEAGRAVCGDGKMSASVGTAFFVTDGLDAEQLLAEADRRMYLAKKNLPRELRTGTPVSEGAGQLETALVN